MLPVWSDGTFCKKLSYVTLSILLLVEHQHQQFQEDMLVVQGVEDVTILSKVVETRWQRLGADW